MTTSELNKLRISGQATFEKMIRWGWITNFGKPIQAGDWTKKQMSKRETKELRRNINEASQ